MWNGHFTAVFHAEFLPMSSQAHPESANSRSNIISLIRTTSKLRCYGLADTAQALNLK
jgi:hypothetical protein